VSDLCLGIAAFVRRSCELEIGSGEANTRDVLVIDDLRSHVVLGVEGTEDRED
jgi:hypothetical protein